MQAIKFLGTVFALLLSCIPITHAHLGAATGRIPILENGEFIGAATSWGIVLKEGEQWLRTCEESVGTAVLFYHQSATQKIFVGTDQGLLTTENGCSYETVTEFTEQSLSSLSAATDAAGIFVIASVNTEKANHIWRTSNDGESFSEITPDVPASFAFISVRISPDGQSIYATGVDYGADAGTAKTRFFMTRNAGLTWQERRLWGADDALLIIGVSTDRVGVVAQRAGESAFYRLDLDVTSLNEPEIFLGTPLDWIEHNHKEYFVLNRQKLFMGSRTEPFVEVDGPARCLRKIAGNTHLFGCAEAFNLGHIMSLAQGETEWQIHLPFLSIDERQCPAQSVGAERCAYLFPNNNTPDNNTPDNNTPDAGAPNNNTSDDNIQNGNEQHDPSLESSTQEAKNTCACIHTNTPRFPLLLWGLLFLFYFKMRFTLPT